MKVPRPLQLRYTLSASALTVVALVLGLSALMALGWSGSPFRLHAASSAIWAAIGGGLGFVEMRRAPRNSDRRFFAAAALCVSSVALLESLVVLFAFAPCGARCA
jgi:hypothetical protein